MDLEPRAVASAAALDTSTPSIVSTGWGTRDYLLRRALAAADVLALLVALAVAGAIFTGGQPRFELLPVALPLLPVWIGLFKLYGLYDRDVKRISHSSLDDVPWLFHALLLGTLGLWAYLRLTGFQRLTLAEATIFGATALVGVCLTRATARRAVGRRVGKERVVLVGWDASSELVAGRIASDPDSDLELIGVVAPGDLEGADESSPPRLGTPSGLADVLSRTKPDRVLLSRSDLSEAEMLDLLHTCRMSSTKISVLPGAIEALGPAVELDEVSGVVLLGLTPLVLGRTSRWLKRSLDVSVSALGLLVTAPLLLAIAVAVRVDCGSPVLFRQRRVGKGDRPFELVKFRTMVAGAEGRRAELMARSRDPNWLDLAHDPRVTRLGRFLRRTSLDELPQLWNVLRGQMSLVGPRPLPESEDCLVRGWARGRLDLTPGITGLWQVRGRNRLPFDEMVKLDYLYVANWSLWMDLRLLLRTAPAVIMRRGAK